MADLPDEVKAAIMLEVHSQLGPLKTEVQNVSRTVRSLYSNGSGGPPGYLETARAEDQQWKTELKEVVAQHGDQLTEIADYVKTHNQQDVEHQNRQREKEERFKFWVPWAWKIAAGFVASVVALSTWGCHTILPIANVLWQEYLKEHPITATELKKVSVNQPDPGLESKSNSRQDVGIPRTP
jgi:hypothetical protein